MGGIKQRGDKKITGIGLSPYKLFFSGDVFTEKPCFCFQYIHPKYNAASCTDKQIVALVHTLEKLSTITWIDIEGSHRHGLGTEKIERNAIRPDIPGNIPKDATFLAIRFSGLAPMIGFRERNIFHIVFFDSRFEVYKH
jgi:hypothetical protein